MSGRRLQVYPVAGDNAMRSYTRFVPLWRASINFAVLWACRYIPFIDLKNWLYRRLGMKVGPKASVGLMAMFDIFFPGLISLGDNCVIGYNVTVLAHEFLVDELRVGPVEIGRRVMIGANTTILPGVSIGDGTIVSACSLVNKDLPPRVLAGGIPARVIRALDEEE